MPVNSAVTVKAVKLPQPSHLPRNAQEVGLIVQQMDKLHKTNFESWVKSPSNASYICTFKKGIIDEYFTLHPHQVIYALEWMTQEWSTVSTAELILKLFYHYRPNSIEFSRLVLGITSQWDMEEICDLVSILLIGESQSSIVGFLNYFMGLRDVGDFPHRDWTPSERIELLQSLARMFQWDHIQLEELCLEFVHTLLHDPIRQRAIALMLINEFREWESENSLERSTSKWIDKFQQEDRDFFSLIHDSVKTLPSVTKTFAKVSRVQPTDLFLFFMEVIFEQAGGDDAASDSSWETIDEYMSELLIQNV